MHRSWTALCCALAIVGCGSPSEPSIDAPGRDAADVDAPRPPLTCENPVGSVLPLTPIVNTDRPGCRDYTESYDANLAVAFCDLGGVSGVFEGPIGGTLSPSSLIGDESDDEPRLSPDGKLLFVRRRTLLPDRHAFETRFVRYSRTATGWDTGTVISPGILLEDTSSGTQDRYHLSTVTRAGRIMLFDRSRALDMPPAPMAYELVCAGASCHTVATYSGDVDLATSNGAAYLSPDGLRLIKGEDAGLVMRERSHVSQRFGAGTVLTSVPGDSPFLDESCSRMYFNVFGGVGYEDTTPPPQRVVPASCSTGTPEFWPEMYYVGGAWDYSRALGDGALVSCTGGFCEGPAEGPFSPVSVTLRGGRGRLQLFPEGDRAIGMDGESGNDLVIYHRVGNAWSFETATNLSSRPIVDNPPASYVHQGGSVTAGTPRRLVVLETTNLGGYGFRIRELEGNGASWVDIDTYDVGADLDLRSPAAPRISADGLRMTMIAYRNFDHGAFYTERASINDRFGPAVRLSTLAPPVFGNVQDVTLWPDCSRAYSVGEDGLYYQLRK